jgi:hypothetical protein
MSICLRRREFLGAVGGAAAWPLGAQGQQGERVRRAGGGLSTRLHDYALLVAAERVDAGL